MNNYTDILKEAYSAFNSRDIDRVFKVMDPDVQWSNGWEGGYVSGHGQVRDYWTRQWKELNPHVVPIRFTERNDGLIEVEVRQVLKDLQGKLLFDGRVKHIYTIQDSLITKMDIEK